VMRTRGASELTLAAGARAAMDELRAARPDLQITEAIDNVQATAENFDSSMHLL
jgi:hypothetical protein